MERAIPTLLLVGLMATSGCLGFITGEEALTFASGEATVSDSALQKTGYEMTREKDVGVEKNFSVANQTRQVKVTNHLVEYKREVSVPTVGSQELARFTVLATPKVKIAGKTFNPVKDISNRELAKQLQQKYETVTNIEPEGNRTVQMLGSGVRVSKFSAEAKVKGGQTISVYLHIAQAETDKDFVIAFAVYPQELDAQPPREQQNVDTLLEGVEHSSSES